MKHVIVIPARLASTRLPNKPLIDIAGKTLLYRTYLRCVEAVPAELVYVATDHALIEKHCREMGMQVVMTSDRCLTGTDRVAEFAGRVGADCYINVQGDEPLMNPNDITAVIHAAASHPGEVVNGYAPIETKEQYHSLTVPKVVVRPDGRLLYMSRTGIPGNKKGEFRLGWRQVCVYGFPRESLFAFSSAGKKTPLEEQEDIEILRFLELGYDVRMIPLSTDSVAVDTPEDVQTVERLLRKEK